MLCYAELSIENDQAQYQILEIAKEPTRAGVPWNPSSKRASGWLVSLLLFEQGGPL